jgi:hypothetical protein
MGQHGVYRDAILTARCTGRCPLCTKLSRIISVSMQCSEMLTKSSQKNSWEAILLIASGMRSLNNIAPGVMVDDACRYVEDLRVVSEINSDAPLTQI